MATANSARDRTADTPRAADAARPAGSSGLRWGTAAAVALTIGALSAVSGFFAADALKPLQVWTPVFVMAEMEAKPPSARSGNDGAIAEKNAPDGPRCMVKSRIRFTLRAPNAGSVVVAGDFNDWSKSATPLVDEDGDGVWTVSVPLEPGVYQYNFLVDGKKWKSDPASDGRRPDGFGGYNSVLRI